MKGEQAALPFGGRTLSMTPALFVVVVVVVVAFLCVWKLKEAEGRFSHTPDRPTYLDLHRST